MCKAYLGVAELAGDAERRHAHVVDEVRGCEGNGGRMGQFIRKRIRSPCREWHTVFHRLGGKLLVSFRVALGRVRRREGAGGATYPRRAGAAPLRWRPAARR